GRLPRDERARLEDHLATCSDCSSELDELRELEGLLRQASVPVRENFRADVLAALPAAGWEARAPRTWSFPAAMFILLGVIATVVIGSGASGGEHAGLGAVSAIFGMFQATVLAGSGLLGASWKGFGLVFQEMLSSPMSLAMFGIFVLCVNILLVSMIRKRRAAAAAVETTRRR
ncbi:MAG TPA: zf-HC2 domain-containing protein, partial [Thermoanaerobaculia bacterium]|nr:zf-HC2 domain-containing protein [Thermoanaerobaculia bacterium]